MQDLEETAAQWLNLTRKTAKPKTTLRRITSIKAFAKCGGIVVLEDYSAPTPLRPLPHPLSGGIAEVRQLMSYARYDHHRALVALCGLAGLRVEEAVSVTEDNIDFRESLLRIRGKGEKERTVPISTECMAALLPAVLRTEAGAPIVGLCNGAARRAITVLGLHTLGRDIASHDLRMTFGTAVNDKYGLRIAQELLGHSSSRTTETYTMVTLDSMRRAVEL